MHGLPKVAALLAALAFAAPARAQLDSSATEPGFVNPASQVTEGNRGAFIDSTPIEVPPFHGIEPKLVITYNSQAPNRQLGVGRELSGFSVIELMSPKKGAPAYTASDWANLDGATLQPCDPVTGKAVDPRGDNTTPGCNLGGGNWTTRVESFLKIYRDTIANTWTVWNKDGVKTVYRPLFTNPGGTVFRWGISQVSDTHQNTVSYSWQCKTDAAGNTEDCYPSTVTYNGTTVTVALQTAQRADPIFFATGKTVGKTRYLVDNITVSVGGSRARKYTQTYGANQKTNNTAVGRVTAIRQWGKDNTSALPSRTFGYAVGIGAYGSATSQAYSNSSRATASVVALNRLRPGTGDFNGDGKTDLKATFIGYEPTSSPSSTVIANWIWLSDGTGFTAPSVNAYLVPGNPVPGDSRRVEADFNDDGKTDLVYLWPYPNRFDIFVYPSNGDGTLRTPIATTYPVVNSLTAWRVAAVDVNGDGKPDLRFWNWYGQTMTNVTLLSNGDGTFAAPVTFVYGSASSPWPWLSLFGPTFPADKYAPEVEHGDYNGDGRMDIRLRRLTDNAGTVTAVSGVMLSNGDGTYSAPVGFQSAPTASFITALSLYYTDVEDVNGDGKTDFILYWRSTTQIQTLSFVSRGDGTFDEPLVWTYTYSGTFLQGNTLANMWRFPGDFNGDGKPDLKLCRWNGSGLYEQLVFLGRGEGNYAGPFFSSATHVVPWTDAQAKNEPVQGDFDGDGITDHTLVSTYSTTNPVGLPWVDYLHAYTVLNSSTSNGLVTSVTTPEGGVKTVTYSALWPRQPGSRPPPPVLAVSSVAVQDGRGSTATTRYVYATALYDPIERAFLGFGYQKTTRPCIAGEVEPNCPYEESWFSQGQTQGAPVGSQVNHALVGRPYLTASYNGSGRLLRQIVNEYTGSGMSVPYSGFRTATWTTDFDWSLPLPALKTTMVDFCSATRSATGLGSVLFPLTNCPSTAANFDAYGNVLQVGHRDMSVSTGRPYFMNYRFTAGNHASWLVAKPKLITRSSSNSLDLSGPNWLSTSFYYDNSTTLGAMPTVGDVTYSSTTFLKDTNLATSTGATDQTWFSQTFDSYGNLATKTLSVDTSAGTVPSTTTYTYDPTYHVMPATVRNGLNQLVKNATAWDPQCGQVVTEYDLNNQLTTTTYDGLCRVSSVSKPLGAFENHTYNFIGSATSQYEQVETPGPNGGPNLWVRTYADGLGRPYRVQSTGPSAAAVTTDTTYNARGQVRTLSRPYYAGDAVYVDTVDYDALDRKTRVVHADNTVVSISYVGWTAKRLDEVGRIVTDSFDGFGNKVAHSELGGSRTICYTYDGLGNQLSSTDPAGNLTTFVFDGLGRKLKQVDPDLGTWTWSFDRNGNRVSQVDAKLQTTTWTYDLVGRVKSRKSGTLPLVTWTYDEPRTGAYGGAVTAFFNLGRLTTTNDGSGNGTTGWAYNYDAAGRQVQSIRYIGATALTIESGFDPANRPLWTKYPDGDYVGSPVTPLGYDPAGRLATVPGLVTSVAYDASGQPVSISAANGTVRVNSYSAQRGWLDSSTTTGNAVTLQGVSYGRFSDGSLSSVTSSYAGESASYTYDGQGQLATATDPITGGTIVYGYDAIGNLISDSSRVPSTIVYGDVAHKHAPTSSGGATYTYDANGNLTSGAGRTITYDANNRPVDVNGTRYEYDVTGARLKTTTSAGTATIYIGNNYEQTNGVGTKYISIGDQVVAQRIGAANYWMLSGEVGSIQGVVNSTGSPVQHQVYGPWGAVARTETSFPMSLGFAGLRQDATGLLFMGARYYDPQLSHFISADPDVSSGLIVGLNRYAYADNNPVSRRDPTGHGTNSRDDFPVPDATAASTGFVDSFTALVTNNDGIPGGIYLNDRSPAGVYFRIMRERPVGSCTRPDPEAFRIAMEKAFIEPVLEFAASELVFGRLFTFVKHTPYFQKWESWRPMPQRTGKEGVRTVHDSESLYRGVPPESPHFASAELGLAEAPLQKGIYGTEGYYSHWTTDFAHAAEFAGPKGVVMRIDPRGIESAFQPTFLGRNVGEHRAWATLWADEVIRMSNTLMP